MRRQHLEDRRDRHDRRLRFVSLLMMMFVMMLLLMLSSTAMARVTPWIAPNMSWANSPLYVASSLSHVTPSQSSSSSSASSSRPHVSSISDTEPYGTLRPLVGDQPINDNSSALITAPYFTTITWTMDLASPILYFAVTASSSSSSSAIAPLYFFADTICYGMINSSFTLLTLPGDLTSVNISTTDLYDDASSTLNITAFAIAARCPPHAEIVIEVNVSTTTKPTMTTTTTTTTTMASTISSTDPLIASIGAPTVLVNATITSMFIPLYAVELVLFEPERGTNLTYILRSSYAAPDSTVAASTNASSFAPAIDSSVLAFNFTTKLLTVAPLLLWNITSLQRWPTYLPPTQPSYTFASQSIRGFTDDNDDADADDDDDVQSPLVVLPSYVTEIVYPRSDAVLRPLDRVEFSGGFAPASIVRYQCVFYNAARTLYSVATNNVKVESFSCTVPSVISNFSQTSIFFVTVALAPAVPLANPFGLRGVGAVLLTTPTALTNGGPTSGWVFSWVWIWISIAVGGAVFLCCVRAVSNSRGDPIVVYRNRGGVGGDEDDDEAASGAMRHHRVQTDRDGWQLWPEAYRGALSSSNASSRSLRTHLLSDG